MNIVPASLEKLVPSDDAVGLSRCDADERAAGGLLVRHVLELAEEAHGAGWDELAGQLVEVAQELLDSRYDARARTAPDALPA